MDSIYQSLVDIVGEDYVSNKAEEFFIYSTYQGAEEPHPPDYVVAPRTTEEVQAIVKLANRERIPVVPLGGAMNAAGLTIPQRGGIALDLKRMDRIRRSTKCPDMPFLRQAYRRGNCCPTCIDIILS